MKIIFVLAVLVVAMAAGGSPIARAETVYSFHRPVKGEDLSFPSAPVPFAKENATLMFKPEGAGPFPGLVLMPTCSGYNASFHVFSWAEKAIQRGYVVIVVDPLRARGVYKNNCTPPLEVSFVRILKDAFDAAAHLRKQPFVKKDRIALMGFSQGAMIGLGASGAAFSAKYGPQPFQAIVSFYPACLFPNRKFEGRPVDVRFLPDDVETPLLVLMGELDTETEPAHCVPLLTEQKSKGAPVEWEVYKNTTHNFDAKDMDGFKKKDFRGVSVEYRYNPETVRASEERAFAFIAKRMN